MVSVEMLMKRRKKKMRMRMLKWTGRVKTSAMSPRNCDL